MSGVVQMVGRRKNKRRNRKPLTIDANKCDKNKRLPSLKSNTTQTITNCTGLNDNRQRVQFNPKYRSIFF